MYSFSLPLKRDTNENPAFSEEKVGASGSANDLCDLYMLYYMCFETDVTKHWSMKVMVWCK